MTGWIEASKKRCWLQASSGFRDSLPRRSDRMLSDLRDASMQTKPLSLEYKTKISLQAINADNVGTHKGKLKPRKSRLSSSTEWEKNRIDL